MNKKEQKKKAEEIRKMLKIEKQYQNNPTEIILEEIYKKHKKNGENEKKEDREDR